MKIGFELESAGFYFGGVTRGYLAIEKPWAGLYSMKSFSGDSALAYGFIETTSRRITLPQVGTTGSLPLSLDNRPIKLTIRGSAGPDMDVSMDFELGPLDGGGAVYQLKNQYIRVNKYTADIVNFTATLNFIKMNDYVTDTFYNKPTKGRELWQDIMDG